MSAPPPRAIAAAANGGALAPATVSVEQLGALLDSLPTLPLVALRLTEAMNSRRTSVQHVAELIGSDPSLAAKLLRLVNSAYFAIPGGVTDVSRAIPFVGFNTIYQLVLTVSVLETLALPDGATFDPRSLWLHSLAVGATARVIGEELGHRDPDALFTAGLLHDMGKIAQCKLIPDRVVAIQDAIHRDGVPWAMAEEHLGIPRHDQIGRELARRWRLPPALAVPIEAHHNVLKPQLRDKVPVAQRTGAEAIAVADVIARDLVAGVAPDEPEVETDPRVAELLTTLGISTARRAELYSRAAAQLERSKPFLALLEGRGR
jgi:putative nucleotidyltransferase with HDIG domain